MTKTTKKTKAKGQTRRPKEQGGNETIVAPADAEAAAKAEQAPAGPEQATGPGTATDPTVASSGEPPVQPADEATPLLPEPTTEPKKQRPPAKKDRLVELLRREDGATIEELMAEFGWQAHTVRGAISIAAKRLGVTAERVEKGRYRLPSA